MVDTLPKNIAKRESEMEKNNLIKLTGLWKKEGKDGNVFFQGKLSYNTNLLLFKNQYKNNEKDPDLVLYIGKAEKKEQQKKLEPEGGEIPF